ncbi:MAG: NHLP bacteriocin export ABC transporter permease/ATPase subunit, partial [Cyanobacteria bacterium Co-bin13]|nr:NHLP bacteriocin export ABC transporter permease/ATPase subunit [Cyanobacteria bacterium Co-bin13]
MAIPLEASEIEPLPRSEFQQWLNAASHEATDSLETWVHRLEAVLSGITSSGLPTPVERWGVLEKGEVYQPAQGAIAWFRLCHGQAHLLGLPDLELTPDLGLIPLGSHLWLQAASTLELEVAPRTVITHVDTLLTGLDRLQDLVLRGIEHLEQQDQQQEYQRFQARAALNTAAMTATIGDLVSVFDTVKPVAKEAANYTATTWNEALLVAAGAVGRAMGIAIAPPAKSEDLRRMRDPLDAIARASHIRTRRVTLRDNWWQKDGGPLLAYTQDDRHPVALLSLSETCYELVDPLRQSRTRCTQAIAETLATEAYTFYRPLPELIRPRDLLQFAVRGHLKELLIVLFTGAAAALLGMVTPQATGILIDHAIPSADKRLLVQLAFGLLATAFGTTLFQLTQGIALMRLETFADSTTQTAVWDRLLKLKASFFRQYSMGDLSSRVSAVSQIRQKLGNTLLKSVFTSLFSFLNLGLLFYYSVPLALIATLVAAINIGVTIVSSLLTLKKVRPLLEQQGKLFGMMVQIINGVAKFRIAGAEPRAFAYWGKQYSHQLKLMLSSQGIEDNLAVVNSLLSALTPAVLFGCAVMLLQQSQAGSGQFTTGTFLAFNAAFGTFISGATSLSTSVVDVLDVLPIWQRAQPILQAQPEVDADKADPGRLSGQLTV